MESMPVQYFLVAMFFAKIQTKGKGFGCIRISKNYFFRFRMAFWSLASQALDLGAALFTPIIALLIPAN